MTTRELCAQGDILLERVDDVQPVLPEEPMGLDPDGALVLARGEVSGHRHAIHGGAVLFRDDALARDIPRDLYVGHVRVTAPGTELVHEEHAAIALAPGTYRVRRQRELDPGRMPVRVVAD